jgi:hypothetical protein
MPRGTRKAKFTFRRMVASEPVSASELETAERLLARSVALAFVADHPDLIRPGPFESLSEPALSSAVVTSVAQTAS